RWRKRRSTASQALPPISLPGSPAFLFQLAPLRSDGGTVTVGLSAPRDCGRFLARNDRRRCKVFSIGWFVGSRLPGIDIQPVENRIRGAERRRAELRADEPRRLGAD